MEVGFQTPFLKPSISFYQHYVSCLPGRRNMSNILLVIINPPVMLMDEIRVAIAARLVSHEFGK